MSPKVNVPCALSNVCHFLTQSFPQIIPHPCVQRHGAGARVLKHLRSDVATATISSYSVDPRLNTDKKDADSKEQVHVRIVHILCRYKFPPVLQELMSTILHKTAKIATNVGTSYFNLDLDLYAYLGR